MSPSDGDRCEEVLRLLDGLLDDAPGGDAGEARRVEAHLARCPACAAEALLRRRVDEGLRSAPVPSPPADFTDLVMARLDRGPGGAPRGEPARAPVRRALAAPAAAAAGAVAAALLLFPGDGAADLLQGLPRSPIDDAGLAIRWEATASLLHGLPAAAPSWAWPLAAAVASALFVVQLARLRGDAGDPR